MTGILTRGPRDITELDHWFVLLPEGKVRDHKTAQEALNAHGLPLAKHFVHWSFLGDDEREAIWDHILQ